MVNEGILGALVCTGWLTTAGCEVSESIDSECSLCESSVLSEPGKDINNELEVRDCIHDK